MRISECYSNSPELQICYHGGQDTTEHRVGLYKFDPHSYGHIYDQIFTPLENSSISLLEIGISGGWSVRLWDKYFRNPSARIYAIDAFTKLMNEKVTDKVHAGAREEFQHKIQIQRARMRYDMHLEVTKSCSGRVRCLDMDAYSRQTVSVFSDESLDIILDDGSHRTEDKLFFVQHYWKKVKPGGWLIVEDYHRSYDEEVLAAAKEYHTSKFIEYASFVNDGVLFPNPVQEGLLCLQKPKH